MFKLLQGSSLSPAEAPEIKRQLLSTVAVFNLKSLHALDSCESTQFEMPEVFHFYIVHKCSEKNIYPEATTK